MVPFTIILLVFPTLLGIVTSCVPSFSVDANNVDHVVPPSIESKISTLAQLTLLAVVPATAHMMVCVLPTAYETAVFGEVTLKGPAVALTVTTMSSLLLAGPPA